MALTPDQLIPIVRARAALANVALLLADAKKQLPGNSAEAYEVHAQINDAMIATERAIRAATQGIA